MQGITDFFTGQWQVFYKVFIEKGRYMAYFNGLLNTIIISIFAVLLGVAIGVVVALVKNAATSNSKLKVFDKICSIYITVIRSTPVYLQMLIIYNMVFTSRNTSPLLSAIVCFGINSGAYVAEIIRAGIQSLDYGQTEAGRSLGLSQGQTMRLIVLPQAIRNILPALGNEFIILIKETSIAGAIAITDLTKAAQYVGSATYQILAPLFIAAVFYFILVWGLSKGLSKLERRLAQSDRG